MLGQIANTNAQKISQMLATVGVNVFFHTVVGDNLDRIDDVLRTAMGRSDVVIMTGGLGPTPDDLTREAAARALGLPLERNHDLEQRIREVFAALGRDMPEDNLRQADIPAGAVPIEQEGTAPGFYLDAPDALLFALPGVPWEMQGMMTKAVLPVLRERAGSAVIVSRQIVVVGLGESHTHQAIADIVDGQSNPTVAFLASSGQVRVRLTARAGDEAGAEALMAPVEERIRSRLGDAAVPGHHDWVGDALTQLLLERGLTVAVAESLTGGLLAHQLTLPAGSSKYFKGSVVAYATESKRDVVGVPGEILRDHGAVSGEAAVALAEGAVRRFDADLGLATTGVAGPAEQEGKPVGTIFVAAHFRGESHVRRVRGYGDRDHVKKFAMTAAFDLGRRVVDKDA